jgi:hypothetical protein
MMAADEPAELMRYAAIDGREIRFYEADDIEVFD